MGFGLLFLGYTLPLIPLPSIDALPDSLGYVLMIVALIKLSPHSKNFKYAWYSLCPLLVLSFTSLLIQTTILINEKLFPLIIPIGLSGVIDNLDLVGLFFKFVFHYFLLNALIDIATLVGNKKIAKKCKRNWIIMFIYFVAAITVNLPLGIPPQINSRIAFAYLIISYPVMVLNSIQIYSCYMWICYEGDEDMPIPEKRSIFIKDADKDFSEEEKSQPAKKRSRRR